MHAFRPQLLSQDEIRAMLAEISPEESRQARKHSLTPPRPQTLFEGLPGSALVRDTAGREYIDCTAQAWSLNVGSHDIFLIFDESQTAFGRIGAMSASEYYGVTPDMLVLSKGLGGGFPIGALLAREDLRPFNGDVTTQRNVIKIKPPLVITEEQLHRALDVIQEALDRTR
jgi:4-aminobutyrate aminotransferase-like enzyme